ncbi:hypothetical protein ACYFX5_05035 [Bremerella sp. T1]|uniref:hypothetical protein n=1 Tax=Bremerella sp. TYQ1 TaxID=3119568 RepID=UPI001CCC9D4A|nr:hypothetical protein [Bremerella volcania]UBM37627.1 hypothetical protein LA756_06990 [Bremerella volcania]
MANEKAKLLLENCNDYFERISAVQSALHLGMSMEEIEDYLDWLRLLRSENCEMAAAGSSSAPGA